MRAYRDLEHCETPYVVRLHRAHALAPPQAAFTFEHPNPAADAALADAADNGLANAAPAVDNSRAVALTFARAPEDGAGELHGFAGYFEAELYGGVTLSTHPDTHTPGMFSWFPIFFPLREPLLLAPGAPVGVAMWRVCGRHRVWYEWAVTAPEAGPVHNPGGRSYWVGL